MNPLPSPAANRAIMYIRTSSAEQGKKYGPGAQRSAIEKFAAAEGLEIADCFHEDISGTTPADDRPVLQAAVAAAYQHGASAVIVAERSRLAREEWAAFDALKSLAAVGLRVIYADGQNYDEAGQFMDSIGHLMAAEDRRRIVARLAAGRAAKAAQAPHSRAQGGKLPYGYRRNRSTGEPEIDPVTAPTVRRVFELLRDGLTVRDAAAELVMQPTTVARIAKRSIYKATQPGRIVDPRVFNAAQDALAARRRR